MNITVTTIIANMHEAAQHEAQRYPNPSLPRILEQHKTISNLLAQCQETIPENLNLQGVTTFLETIIGTSVPGIVTKAFREYAINAAMGEDITPVAMFACTRSDLGMASRSDQRETTNVYISINDEEMK
jgi:hypothetical protein